MTKYEVALHVDGLVYLTVEADDGDAARDAALSMVGREDFVVVVRYVREAVAPERQT